MYRNFLCYISFVLIVLLLSLYPLKIWFDTEIKISQIDKLNSYFSGKKAIKNPKIFIKSESGSYELESDLAVEAGHMKYNFIALKGIYVKDDLSYELRSDSALYDFAKDTVSFVEKYNIYNEEQEFKGNDAILHLSNNNFYANGNFIIDENNRLIKAGQGHFRLSEGDYNLSGGVLMHFYDLSGSKMARAKQVLLRDTENKVYFSEKVSILDQHNYLKSDQITLSYTEDINDKIIIDNVSGQGNFLFYNPDASISGDSFTLTYVLNQRRESLPKNLLVKKNVYYSSATRGENLQSDEVEVLFSETKNKDVVLDSIHAQGKTKFFAKKRLENLAAEKIDVYFSQENSEAEISQLVAKNKVLYNSDLSGEELSGDAFNLKYQAGVISDSHAKGNIVYKSPESKTLLKATELNLQTVETSKKILTAMGDVYFSQGDPLKEMYGDKFKLHLIQSKDASLQLSQLYSEGNIRYSSATEKVSSDYGFYDKEKEFLKLTDNVKLVRDDGVFYGDIFTYDYKNEIAELSSSSSKNSVTIEIDENRIKE